MRCVQNSGYTLGLAPQKPRVKKEAVERPAVGLPPPKLKEKGAADLDLW